MFSADEVETNIRQLNNSKWELRQIAVIHLVAMGPEIGQRLIPIISKPQSSEFLHDYMRSHCAEALGKLKLVESVDPLIRACTDSSGWFREHVASALGDIKDDRATQPLLKMLKTDDYQGAREAAAWALRRYPVPQVFQSLVEAFGDEDIDVKESASDAMIEIGQPAIEFLTAGLQNANSAIRSECEFALQAIKEDINFENSWKDFDQQPFSRRFSTITHLWQLDNPKVIPGLELGLRDSEYTIRLAAVLALGRMDDPRVRAILETTLKDNHELVRTTARRLFDISGKSNEV